MRTSALLLAAAVFAAVLPARAEVGDLAYLDAVPKDGQVMEGEALNAMSHGIGKAGEGSGTTSPKAVVGNFLLGVRNIAAAIDAKAADAKSPDVIRFDLSGEGKFTDANTFPLRLREGMPKDLTILEFGPALLRVRDADREIPLLVSGMYYRQEGSRYLQVQAVLAAQGQCRFGKQVLPVRVVEGCGNLRLGEPAVITRQVRGVPAGDRVYIGQTDGSFKNPRGGLLGQLVRVDNAWYRVSVDQAGMKVTAEAVDVQGGKIRVAHPQWSATLVGKANCLSIQGGSEPIDVPADQYVIVDYREMIASGQQGDGGTLVRGGQRDLWSGQAKSFDVGAGKTVDVAVGSPIKVTVKATAKGRAVAFSLEVADASGASIDYALGGKGERVPEPKLVVSDAGGKEVYRCTLEYG